MRLNPLYSGLLVVLLGLSAASHATEQPVDQPEPEKDSVVPVVEGLLPEVTPALDQNQMLQVYQQQIAIQEAAFDTYDPHISESLNGLGKVQQQLGKHEDALKSFRRAMHIQRVNNGIYSLSQEPMIRSMMASYEILKDIENADQSFEQLYSLYTHNHNKNSPEMLALLKEKSDWHIKLYAQSPGRKSLHHLGNAYRLVVDALNVVSADTGVGNITLLPLWRNLAVANFLLADYGRRHPVGQKEGFTFAARDNSLADPLTQDEVLVINSYRSGVIALENIVLFHYNNADSTQVQKAASLADLGDWHLMFGRSGSAAKAYRESWGMLAGDEPSRKQLFSVPRIIPVAEGEPAGEDAHSGNPYVVARLSITNQGVPRDIEIVETFPENSEEVKKVGYKVLRNARFRPQLAEGEMIASSEITYHLEIAQ